MPITHAKVSGVSDGGNVAQVQPSDWNDDHSSPTLAEVLAEGYLTGGASIVGTSEVGTPPDVALIGGAAVDAQEAGYASLTAGAGPAAENGGSFDAWPGTDGNAGGIAIKSRGSYGNEGEVLTVSDSTYATWQLVLTSDAGAPGSSFVSLLYLDTDSGTGGLYAWDGAGYTKVALALT